MNPITEDGSSRINSKGAFCELLNGRMPSENTSFRLLIESFDDEILKRHPKITQNALNNVHGSWYEWLISISFINYHISHPESFVVFPLPNITQFDVARLYTDELYDLVVDLRRKVNEAASVQLITSNPDFVIFDSRNLDVSDAFTTQINVLDEGVIRQIMNAYSAYASRCGFEDIVGYVSAKLSLRPDRRLQIPHEGSLMKAIYTHIQTRKWVIHPNGLKYYAFTSRATEPDKNALKTVATHSITTVFDTPQAAVDDLFEIDTIEQCNTVFDKILIA